MHGFLSTGKSPNHRKPREAAQREQAIKREKRKSNIENRNDLLSIK